MATGTITNDFLDLMLDQTFYNNNIDVSLIGTNTFDASDRSTLIIINGELHETNGYAAQTIASWNISAGDATANAAYTFTAAGGTFQNPGNTADADVYGYFLTRNDKATFDSVVAIEYDADVGVPYTITDTQTYEIDLSVSTA